MTIEAIRFRAMISEPAGHPDMAIPAPLMVLQVLERTPRSSPYHNESDKLEWRDAAPTDLLDVAKFTADYRGLQRIVDEAKADARHVDKRLDQLQERLDLAKFPNLPDRGDDLARFIAERT